MEIVTLFNNFLNSVYSTATIVGAVFVLVARKALAQLVTRLSVSIHNKDIKISTPQSEQAGDASQTQELEKIRQVLRELKIKSSTDLETFLDDMTSELLSQEQRLKEAKKLTRALLELKTHYEFAYLNLFLVDDSKSALRLLAGEQPMTRELFLASIKLADAPENPQLEREAIFNALWSNGLVKKKKGLLRLSEKGLNFLKYIELT